MKIVFQDITESHTTMFIIVPSLRTSGYISSIGIKRRPVAKIPAQVHSPENPGE